jgi:hypothetical protein
VSGVSGGADFREARADDEISLGYSEADQHVSRSSVDASQGDDALWVLGDEELRLEAEIMQRIQVRRWMRHDTDYSLCLTCLHISNNHAL